MKISAALISAVAAQNDTKRTQRGFAGPSASFTGVDTWPVKDCKSNKECWGSNINKEPGWANSKARGLMCDLETGTCKCKPNFMDANDNPRDGCELSIAEEQCSYGSCENHDVSGGMQCGGWKFLSCSDDSGCCECNGELTEEGHCVGDTSMEDQESCDAMCQDKCSAMTDNVNACVNKCTTHCEESGMMEGGAMDEDEMMDGEKPEDEMMDGEKPEDEMMDGEKPDGEKPEGDKPEGDKPEGDKPEGDKPEGEKPEDEMMDGEKPEDEMMDGEKPEDEMMDGEKPDGDKPEGEKPEGEKPDGEKPDMSDMTDEDMCHMMCEKRCEGKPDKPAGEKPEGEMMDGEKPEGEMMDGEKPEGEMMDGEKPEEDMFEEDDKQEMEGEEKPEGEDKPEDGEKPEGEDKPEDEEGEMDHMEMGDCHATCYEKCMDPSMTGDKPDGEEEMSEEMDCDLSVLGDAVSAMCKGQKCFLQCEDMGAVPHFNGEPLKAVMCKDGMLYAAKMKKPQGDKPDGEKPEGEKPEGEMEGEKPEGEKPEGEKPEEEMEDEMTVGDKQDDEMMDEKPEDEMMDEKPEDEMMDEKPEDEMMDEEKPMCEEGEECEMPEKDPMEPEMEMEEARAIDGPLECGMIEKPEMDGEMDGDADADAEAEAKPSPCDSEETFRCPAMSTCKPADKKPGFVCECDEGFKMVNGKCRELKPVVDVSDEQKCPKSFRNDLKKLTVNDLKKPVNFAGKGSLLMQIETQIKFLWLNRMTYTGFLEFTKKNCGTNFIKAMGAGMIDFQIYDGAGSEGLYSVSGQKAVFFKNKKGYDGASSGTVQFTKNFKTLGDMTGNDELFEINQSKNKKNRIVPARDSFYLGISGDMVSKEAMGDFYETCFDPSKLLMFIVDEKAEDGYRVFNEDYTSCFYNSKMKNFLDVDCKSPAVIDGELTDDVSFATMLESDFPECVEA